MSSCQEDAVIDGLELPSDHSAVLRIGIRSLHDALSTPHCLSSDERTALVLDFLKKKQYSFVMPLAVEAPEMHSVAALIAAEYQIVYQKYLRLRRLSKIRQATDLLNGAIRVPYPKSLISFVTDWRTMAQITADEEHMIDQIRTGNYVLCDVKQLAARKEAVAERERQVAIAQKNVDFLRIFYEKWKTLPDKPMHNFQVKRVSSETTRHRLADKVGLADILTFCLTRSG